MDVAFFRALTQLSTSTEPYCIFALGEETVVCTELAQEFSTLRDVPRNTFVTGWQHADGLSGQWHAWNNVEKFPRAIEHGRTSIDLAMNDAWKSSHTREEFVDSINSMIEDMKRGEYFLTNITRHVSTLENPDAWAVALGSCLHHETPYRFFHWTPELSVLGLSPEHFVSIDGESIECRPMKGTHTDADALSRDEKEFEENTMIIDLVRSDLSRVCNPASISVVSRDNISQHPGLFQLSSTVRGTLDNDDLCHSITELMEIASVTGTPKPYVVKKIKEYEKGSRGIYCGAYGYVDTTQSRAELAVAIRTIEFTPDETKIGTGAGITVRSNPESEWEETELKVAQLQSLCNRTMEQKHGVFTSLAVTPNRESFQLHLHVERLIRHGAIYGFDLEYGDVIAQARQHIEEHTFFSEEYLRIEVHGNGDVVYNFLPQPQSAREITLGVAWTRAIVPYSEIPKTRDRSRYDAALIDARSSARCDIDDSLVVIGEAVTETTRSNIFVRLGADIVTPPLDSSISGVARHVVMQELSTTHTFTERSITLDDLHSADEIVATNSVRGAQSVGTISSVIFDNDLSFETHGSLFQNIRSIVSRSFSHSEGE